MRISPFSELTSDLTFTQKRALVTIHPMKPVAASQRIMLIFFDLIESYHMITSHQSFWTKKYFDAYCLPKIVRSTVEKGKKTLKKAIIHNRTWRWAVWTPVSPWRSMLKRRRTARGTWNPGFREGLSLGLRFPLVKRLTKVFWLWVTGILVFDPGLLNIRTKKHPDDSKRFWVNHSAIMGHGKCQES